MRLPVPEVGERFDCFEDALEHIIRLSGVIVDKAIKRCPSPTVADIPSYALAFIRKVLVQSSTLVMVARERKDYNTVCAMVRMLADNMATLNLVYDCDDKEEMVLRHLLYVMDGVSERHSTLVGHPMHYDGKVPRETYEALKKQVQGAIDNAASCMSFCENGIKSRGMYQANREHIDKLINKKDWKYKQLGNSQLKSYTWKEMYEKLDIKTGAEMFPFLSQYVHGLSVSNIALNDPDDFDAPLSFAVCLLGWLFSFLRKEYEPYVGEFTMEDVRKMVPGVV
jgi:hypothetical protein